MGWSDTIWVIVLPILYLALYKKTRTKMKKDYGLALRLNIYSNISETTQRCYKLYNETHCEYYNIYFDGQYFYADTKEYESMIPININSHKFAPPWKPNHLNSTQKVKAPTSIRKGVSIIIQIPYADNIGHHYLDVLHPSFLKLLMLNLSKDTPFDFYIHKRRYPELKIGRRFSKPHRELYRKFSKGNLYVLDPLPTPYPEMVMIERLLVGVGKHGLQHNRYQRLLGSRDYDSLSLFRDRVYEVYQINKNVERNKILIINNKRFVNGKSSLIGIISNLSKRYPQYKIEFVDFYYIKYRKQLQMLSQAIMLISAAGTGLLNHMMLQDYSYIYNMGQLNFEGPCLYYEEFVAESQPRLQAFYYYEPGILPHYNTTLVYSDLCRIMDNNVVPKVFSRNMSLSGSGLSFVGQLSENYCRLFPDYCDNYYRCYPSCIWPSQILLNSCRNTSQPNCDLKPPFACDQNYNCKIVN